jgi:hypothetical protein
VSLLLGCPWLRLGLSFPGLACLVDGFSIRPAMIADTTYVFRLSAAMPDTVTIALRHDLPTL